MASSKPNVGASGSGGMSEAAKRRGDDVENPSGDGHVANHPPMVINYNPDFDVERLQHMIVALQGENVLASYPGKRWEVELIGHVVEAPMVRQSVAAPKPKPAVRQMVHRGESVQIPREVAEILRDDALMREDFADFTRWHVVEDEGVVFHDNAVTMPTHDLLEIKLPAGVKSFEEWGSIVIDMPQYRGLDVTFADLYTQSFRDIAAEAYCRFICGRFRKMVPTDCVWTPSSQGPDLCGYLLASNWAVKLDTSKRSVAGDDNSERRGYRRAFRGCRP
eukprot:symbB.v1.2.039295.t1/scaffold6467.1/size17873/3